MIFPQARQAVGGIFDHINQAAATPAFGLGIGLLSGSPQAGFQNAQNAIRTQQAGEAFGQGQDPQSVREARFLFPGNIKQQRKYVEQRTIGQAGGVQSTFIDKNGQLNLIMRDGTVTPTGKDARNLGQVTDVGGVPTLVDRQAGTAAPISTPEQVGGNAAAIASIKTFGELADTARAELPALREKTNATRTSIQRLLPSGDLHEGFLESRGLRVPGAAVLPGAQRRDAESVANQLISELTIENLAAFKGAISEKELEAAANAATNLSNTNISKAEATRALQTIDRVFRTSLERQESLAAQSPAGAPTAPTPNTGPLTPEEQAELEALKRELGQ